MTLRSSAVLIHHRETPLNPLESGVETPIRKSSFILRGTTTAFCSAGFGPAFLDRFAHFLV